MVLHTHLYIIKSKMIKYYIKLHCSHLDKMSLHQWNIITHVNIKDHNVLSLNVFINLIEN